jgi:hypothetical protein
MNNAHKIYATMSTATGDRMVTYFTAFIRNKRQHEPNAIAHARNGTEWTNTLFRNEH